MASQSHNLIDQTPPPSSDSTDQFPQQPSVPSQCSHEIQLRYKLAPATFKTLCTITTSPSRHDVLKKACFATEVRSCPIRQNEKAFLREVNDHTAIPYPIAENLSQPWHKVFLLVQVDMLGTEWPKKLTAASRKELQVELSRMYKLLDQVLRCLVDIMGERDDGKGVSIALDVLRSVKARIWEGSEKQLLQVNGIGAAKLKLLANAGIKTIHQLTRLEFYHIERILSRNPPFGTKLLHDLAGFPSLTLSVEVLGRHILPNTQPMDIGGAERSTSNSLTTLPTPNWITRVVLGYRNEQVPIWKANTPWVTLVIEGLDGRLVWFWRGSVKRLTGGKEMIIELSASKGEVLRAALACEDIVGTIIRKNIQV